MEHSSRIEPVSALVFRVMGAGIGFDTDQIDGMADAGKVSEKDFKLVTMHELLGLDICGSDIRGFGIGDCARPKVIFVKDGYLPAPLEQGNLAENTGGREVRRIGVVVNEPEEIVDIPLAALRPMPQLVAPRGDLNGFWAVALMPDEMIFMMDVRKMIGKTIGEVRWMDEKRVAGN